MITERHTPTYEHLTAQVTKLQAFVTDASFSDVITDDVQVEMFPELVRLLTEFLENPEIEAFDRTLVREGPPSDVGTKNPDADWLSPGKPGAALDRVLDETRSLAFGGKGNPRTLAQRFRRAVEALFDVCGIYVEESTFTGNPVARVCRQFRDQLRTLEVREMNLYVEKSAEALESIRDLEENAQGTVSSLQQAAGAGGDAKMSSFYTKLASDERRDANAFRWLTAFLALVAGAAALMFVLGAGTGVAWLEIRSDDYVRLIQRGILIAGIFGLAAYFARQAHHHRSMANWAGSLAVQLQTFDAYIAAVENPEVKDELRKSFAARAFGDHPAMKGEPTVTPSAAAMDTAVGWAAKLTAGGSK